MGTFSRFAVETFSAAGEAFTACASTGISSAEGCVSFRGDMAWRARDFRSPVRARHGVRAHVGASPVKIQEGNHDKAPVAASRRGRSAVTNLLRLLFHEFGFSSKRTHDTRAGVFRNPRHCSWRGGARPLAGADLRASPGMFSAFVPQCLAVIKLVHDALPARVQAVTDGWPSEVLLTSIVVLLLLNIYFFLWNVKAHEWAKRRRLAKKSR